MKKHTSLALAVVMIAGICLTVLASSGCSRRVHRQRFLFFGDPNVTVTKLQRRKVKGRRVKVRRVGTVRKGF